MKRLIRGGGALLVLVGVLIGAPVALVNWGHRPSSWSGLLRPDDGSLLLIVLTGVGWLAWAAFTASTVVEAVRLIYGVNLRLPLVGGLQHVTAGLLLAVLALAPEAPVAAAGPEPASLPVSLAPTAPAPLEVAAPEAPAAEGYLVAAGDDLWSVSEALLGDGGRWREIVAANPQALADPTARLSAGSRLALPAGAAVAPKRVVVERGDTLSGLALEHLGTAKRWPAIAAANSDLITDPDHIEVGWRLDLPAAGHSSRTTRPASEGGQDQPSAEPELDAVPGPGEAPDTPPNTGGAPDATGPDASPAKSAEPQWVRAGPSWSAPARPPEPRRAGSRDATATPNPAPAEGLATPAAITTEPATPEPVTPEPATPAPASHPGVPTASVPTATIAATDPAPADPADVAPLVGIFGSLAAAAVIGVLETRRYLRLRARPAGRRLIPADEPATRLRAAIGSRQRPDRMTVLDAALRAIGAHCFEHGLTLPELAQVTLGETTLRFDWVAPAGDPPPGFSGDAGHWQVTTAWSAPAGDGPCPYPALVSLGSSENADVILVDAERSRVLGVAAGDAELRRSALGAMAVELACAPWSQELRLVAVGDDTALLAVAGAERVRVGPSVSEALDEARRLVAERRSALAGEPLARLRVDPDRADAVAPVVYVVNAEVPAGIVAEWDGLLGRPRDRSGRPAGHRLGRTRVVAGRR